MSAAEPVSTEDVVAHAQDAVGIDASLTVKPMSNASDAVSTADGSFTIAQSEDTESLEIAFGAGWSWHCRLGPCRRYCCGVFPVKEIMRFIFTYIVVAFTFMVFIGKATHTFDYMWIALVATVVLMIPDAIGRWMDKRKKHDDEGSQDTDGDSCSPTSMS